MRVIRPQDQVFLYLEKTGIESLRKDISTDVVVIGGGMAGLAAAQSFRAKGLDVVLLEKSYCGAGATGKSTGFITPDSELSLSYLVRTYGPLEAKKIWDFVISGVTLIANNISKFNVDCDYQAQDTLVLAHSERRYQKDIIAEYNARSELNFLSTLYTQQELSNIIGSDAYKGGVAYSDTFSINGYRYCSGMKQVLQNLGVHIYEESPVIAIQNKCVITPKASVKAQYIIVCTDHFAASFPTLRNKIYHVQTFVMLSSSLSPMQIRSIFPQKQYMVWDTELVYQYYRIINDNRLILGGGSLLHTYASQEQHNNVYMIKKLTNYWAKKFPHSSPNFEYIWPGLIGVSKDLMPIAGRDAQMSSVYYIAAATGLPWAAALGAYSAAHIINNDKSFDHYFSPYRSFTLGPLIQTLLGKKITFALSNFLKVGSL